MQTIRWGIIGCGDVTEVKSGPALQKAKHSELVAVMRRTPYLAEDYAQRHRVPRWYDNATALINDPEVDIVYVATPPSSHKQYALMSAKAGKPVYVEKPMALNFAECEEMISGCRAAAVPLFVAYYRRALPRFLKIKQLLEDGRIGAVRFVNISFYQPPAIAADNAGHLPWRVHPEIAGGGLFVDLAAHMLDFLDYALGPIVAAQGIATNQLGSYPAEDIVAATFRFASGVLGTGVWCFSAGEKRDLTEIIGSEGRISYSTFDASPVLLASNERIEEFSIEYPSHIQQPLVQMIVDYLNGMGNSPSTGETAARTSWVMDQMLKSGKRSHSEVVS